MQVAVCSWIPLDGDALVVVAMDKWPQAFQSSRRIWKMPSGTWWESWGCPVQGQGLDPLILVCHCQLRVFHGSGWAGSCGRDPWDSQWQAVVWHGPAAIQTGSRRTPAAAEVLWLLKKEKAAQRHWVCPWLFASPNSILVSIRKWRGRVKESGSPRTITPSLG